MSYKFSYTSFQQPIGEFYFGVINALKLLEFYTIQRRQYTGDKGEGTQRKHNIERISEIADYVLTADACFPTAIILSLEENEYKLDKEKRQLEIISKAEIIDGQHRILGLEAAKVKYGSEAFQSFQLPCIFILEPTEEEKAYIFATINGKQQKVNSSVVYDLFGVSETDDPFSILHKLARALNFRENSPFYKRLKMLGTRVTESESLAQGTFIKHLIPKVTKNALLDRDLMKRGKFELMTNYPDLVLRPYVTKKHTEELIQLFMNIFNAVKKVWNTEWTDHKNYILSKTTGYIGIIEGIDPIIRFGIDNKIVTERYFGEIFEKMKGLLITENVKLDSNAFPPGSQGERKLTGYLQDAWSKVKAELTAKKITELNN